MKEDEANRDLAYFPPWW